MFRVCNDGKPEAIAAGPVGRLHGGCCAEDQSVLRLAPCRFWHSAPNTGSTDFAGAICCAPWPCAGLLRSSN